MWKNALSKYEKASIIEITLYLLQVYYTPIRDSIWDFCESCLISFQIKCVVLKVAVFVSTETKTFSQSTSSDGLCFC